MAATTVRNANQPALPEQDGLQIASATLPSAKNFSIAVIGDRAIVEGSGWCRASTAGLIGLYASPLTAPQQPIKASCEIEVSRMATRTVVARIKVPFLDK
jgi:hypothetical protein